MVKDTGPSDFLSSGEGLLRFTTEVEAAEAVEAVNTDYQRHARAARGVAEAYFEGKKTVQRILDAALDRGAGGASQAT